MRSRIVIILVIIILLMGGGLYYLYDKIQNLEVDLTIETQNTVALQNNLRVSKNKVDDLEYSKAIYVTDKQRLEELNLDLFTELKKEKVKVNTLIVTNIKLKGKISEMSSGVTYIPPTGIETDSTYRIDWNLFEEFDANNSRRVAGYSTFSLDRKTYLLSNVFSKLVTDDINFKIIQGIREVDGVVEIFARSDYPGFGVNDINSAIIDPMTHPVLSKFTKKKTKNFGISLYSGYGFTYNAKTQKFLDGVQVGGGVYWQPDLTKLFK